jgi:hypothetical protein
LSAIRSSKPDRCQHRRPAQDHARNYNCHNEQASSATKIKVPHDLARSAGRLLSKADVSEAQPAIA